MLIIPAIDIKSGKCVRLFQGRMDKETVYSDDPVSVAKRWEDEGAEFLHIVDLDGAVSGVPKNKEIIGNIIKSVKIPLEVGGGVRNIETIKEYFSIGAKKVIIGTVAWENPILISEVCKMFPERMIVGIDAKNGNVAVRGWEDVTETSASTLAKRFEGMGISGIIYTDIKNIMKLKKHGVTGVIVGKALYSGAVNLKEAIKLCLHEE